MSECIPTLHCLFSYDNKLGGSVHAALNICKYLAEAGVPVEVIAPFSEADDVGYLATDYPVLTCHRVARSFPKRFANSSELGSWLEANLHRFRVVEIHGVWVLATWQAARACLKQGIPYFIRPHGSLEPVDLQKHSLLKQLLGPIYVQWLLRHAAGVICTAELEVERLITYGAKPHCHALPLPVPLSDQPGNGRLFRMMNRIPIDAQVVLFLSRLDGVKGLDMLIPVLRKLKDEFPKLWFVLAGTGTSEYLNRVRSWLVKYRIQSFTSEVGFIFGQDKLDAFAAADLFVLPSRKENFGLVNIEAMHAGLPLLISDGVFIHREIAEAGAAVICQPCLESITEKLRSILSGSIDLRAMGERGRALVQQRYRPETATKELIKLYAQTTRATPSKGGQFL